MNNVLALSSGRKSSLFRGKRVFLAKISSCQHDLSRIPARSFRYPGSEETVRTRAELLHKRES